MTLNRYDLLRRFLLSVQAGTVQPDAYYIIDNGHSPHLMEGVIQGIANVLVVPIDDMIMDGHTQLGLAQAWNWFLQAVPDDRIICNDDLIFAPDSLRCIVETEGEFVSPLATTNACSCFMLNDRCVEKVGLFDEEISPGYAYFEDCDYVERMVNEGLKITSVECGVVHDGSQTIAAFSAQDMDRHHQRFVKAQENFIRKWGRLPRDMERQFKTGVNA